MIGENYPKYTSLSEEDQAARDAYYYAHAALETIQERREWSAMADRRMAIVAAAAFVLGSSLASVGWLVAILLLG